MTREEEDDREHEWFREQERQRGLEDRDRWNGIEEPEILDDGDEP